MLEVKDIQKLFIHLREVHPNCPPDKIPRLTTGLAKMWGKTFAGYSYQQVEDAADRRAAENRFWPDASEIKAYLPKLPERVVSGRELDASMLEAVKWIADVCTDYHRRLKEAGLPTLAEARAQGMTCAEWAELTEAVELLPDRSRA